MREDQFDRKIRQLLESVSETPDAAMWDRIGRAVGRKRRLLFFRRISIPAAAAAVLAAFFIIAPDRSVPEPDRTADLMIRESSEPEISLREQPEQLKQPEAAEMPLRPEPKPDKSEKTTEEQPETGTGAADRRSGQPVRDTAEKKIETVPPAGEIISYSLADAFVPEQESSPGRGRFTISARGDLSPAHAAGNVDFSSPQYSSGLHNSASGYGIVPISDPVHSFPVTVGIDLSYFFLNGRLGAGLGVNYTYMKSRYEALIDQKPIQGRVEQKLHYIGVPVDFFCNVLYTDHLSFYVSVGGMLESAVALTYGIEDLDGNRSLRRENPSGIQWSAHLGLGFEYRFLDFMGIYVDPRLTYFFDCGQPYSVRTEQPLQLDLELGFRFHL